MTANAARRGALRRVVAGAWVLGGWALIGITLPPLTSVARAGDVKAGKAVFTAICAGCHSAQSGQDGRGPSLYGIVGRRTGEGSNFPYSPANQASNIIWDTTTLDSYIQAPHAIVPGTKMTYGGLKDAGKRDDLIAYLATLK